MSLRAIALLSWTLMQGNPMDAFAVPTTKPLSSVDSNGGATSGWKSWSEPAQGLPHARAEDVTVPLRAPFVVKASEHHGPHERGYSARHGWLLRSNSALGLGRVDGVSGDSYEHGQLEHWRFTTTNHVSIGYGWRPNWALTLDGFRAVVPHYPHPGQKAAFSMRVDTETLALGLGSTLFIAPWAMHIGTSLGFAMSRIGGDSLTAPTHRGLGSLSFVGFELMRSQGIGVVLAAQVFGIVARRRDELLTTRTYALSLGVTYW